MVGHEVAEEIEPEERNLGQDAALMGNASGQHIVECRDAIGGNKEKMFIIEMVHIPHFTAGVQFQFREVGVKQNGVEKLRAHDGILQLENVAYSNLPEIFVNGLSCDRTQGCRMRLKGNVLTADDGLETSFQYPL